MTLEQTTEWILAAAEAQNLEALLAASKEREAAIAWLVTAAPTVELHHAVAASLAAGDEAGRAIHRIKQRIRNESRRLANIEHGFVRALRPAAGHRIDCNG